MANDLNTAIPQLLAQGLLALREMCVMPQLVNSQYSALALNKGEAIRVPIPTQVKVQDVTPAPTPPSTDDTIMDGVNIPLDNWKEAPFYMTDKDFRSVQEGTIPTVASEAIRALSNAVNLSIFNSWVGPEAGIYGLVGTPGLTPFADVGDATAARRILLNQAAPTGNWRMVLDPNAEENALKMAPFYDTSIRGDSAGIREGQIGRKFGFDFYMDQQVPTYTKQGAGTVLINQADVSIGDTTVALDGVTSALGQGDVFTVAGDSQTYVVLQAGTLATNDQTILKFGPPAQVAWADNASVDIKDSRVLNLAFHRDAFAFANAPFDDPELRQLGAIVESASDAVSGLTLRLEVTREHKRTRFSYDMLWGTRLVRGELGCVVAG